jgi:acyl carrier protein
MSLSYTQIQDAVVRIIEDMIQDWDVEVEDSVGPQTTLVAHLGFSSIDIIHFTVAVEDHFSRPKLGFNELLMVNGKYVEDLSIAQVAAFLDRKLNSVAKQVPQ